MIEAITDSKLRLEVLSDDDVQKVHQATLEVLAEVGVRFPHQESLNILADHGAHIDWNTQVARFPSGLIDKWLAKAPPSYTLAALKPDQDLPLDGKHAYLGTDGCGVEIIDINSGEKRRTLRQDVAEIARVVDLTNEIAFHWVPISAQDCPPHVRSLYELEATWLNSSKHVQTETILTTHEMEAAIEMAAVLTGGRDALRQRPILSIMQCTTSPLGQDTGSLEAGLIAARAGLPVGFMTMASCAFNAPATMAGDLVVGNAEVLSALALMQMASPGCPIFYAAAQTAMDLRTGGYTGGGPEDYLFGAATNQLADFYHVPLSMGAFATGAPEPNWQAAIDNSFSAFMAVLSMSDMLLGAGLLSGSRIFSYEELMLDCEIWSMVRHMSHGIVINETTLALDAIREVGPVGTFMTHPHTLANMRGLWQPRFMDRRPYPIWEEQRNGAREWALARARQLMNSDHASPLPAEAANELHKIITSVEAREIT
ncbi:MAG: hypothetical protein HPY76_07775 [Anaerolineae bacterium]|nr:hypothetical protein [Anaerolineae bacterium]